MQQVVFFILGVGALVAFVAVCDRLVARAALDEVADELASDEEKELKRLITEKAALDLQKDIAEELNQDIAMLSCLSERIAGLGDEIDELERRIAALGPH